MAESHLSLGRVVAICLAVLACEIVVRLVFVMGTQAVRDAFRPKEQRIPRSSSFVIGWAGMRGVVTLAAALMIPSEVPHHEVVMLIALTVVVGTLFGQGLSLPALTRALKVRAPDPASDALARATVLQQAADAGMKRMAELDYDDHTGVCDLIRSRLDQRTFAAWERLSTASGEETPSDLYARIRLEMIEAERARVLEIRSEGRVPSEVLREDRGFILTGRDLPAEAWHGHRPPADLETSVPGVFAIGDIRSGSMKRVASATGEGATVVSLVHAHLAGLD